MSIAAQEMDDIDKKKRLTNATESGPWISTVVPSKVFTGVLSKKNLGLLDTCHQRETKSRFELMLRSSTSEHRPHCSFRPLFSVPTHKYGLSQPRDLTYNFPQAFTIMMIMIVKRAAHAIAKESDAFVAIICIICTYSSYSGVFRWGENGNSRAAHNKVQPLSLSIQKKFRALLTSVVTNEAAALLIKRRLCY